MIKKFRENGPARLLGKMLAAAALAFSGVANPAVISAGTPTITVPDYLADGSYLGFITVTLAGD